MMKYFFSCICLIHAFCSNGMTYYVSNSGSNTNNGLSVTNAWQTLSKVESSARVGIIHAGDSILFKVGDLFTGTIVWSTLSGLTAPTGSAGKPITFSTYGSGPKPVFQFPKEIRATAENRVLMRFVGVNYIVIDGLNFTDRVDTLNDKRTPANCGIPLYFGEVDDATSNHCIIKNVDISLCGMGVVIVGDSNMVTNCNFKNFKNLKSTADTGGSTAYEDYGANAVTITGSYNEVSHNYISGAWAESLDFGWNGGAIEMFNTCNRNKIIYNEISDCGGIAEFGGTKKGSFAEDNLFAFNLITNCGTLSYCNLTGLYGIVVSNLQYFDNSIIENQNSRFSGTSTGNGISGTAARSLIFPDRELFAYNGSPQVDVVFNLKNNSFNLSTGIGVARKSNDPAKYVHENNFYNFSGGSTTNYNPNASETVIIK